MKNYDYIKFNQPLMSVKKVPISVETEESKQLVRISNIIRFKNKKPHGIRNELIN